MTEKEMLNNLQSVWENMTTDQDRNIYAEMLPLLENMLYFLRYDLQINPSYSPMDIQIKKGAFIF